MIDYKYINRELKKLAVKDVELFETKLQEIIALFSKNTENPPHIKRLERLQKSIDNQVSFQKINNNSQHFEQKRKEIIVSFMVSFSGSNKDKLLGLHQSIEQKYECLGLNP